MSGDAKMGFRRYLYKGVELDVSKNPELVARMEASARIAPEPPAFKGKSSGCKDCHGHNFDEAWYCTECYELVSVKKRREFAGVVAAYAMGVALNGGELDLDTFLEDAEKMGIL